MASRASEPNAEVHRAPSLGRCPGPSAPESQASFEVPMHVPGPERDPMAARGPGLPRNVLSERERRKRISASCERLRALLPRFDGRREDMASVLEMAVQFLQLASSLMPTWEQHHVPAPARATWHAWQGDVLQWTLASQVSAGGSDPGTAVSGLTLQQEPLGSASRGVGESKAPAGLSELLDGLPALPGPSSLGSRLPPWPSCTWQPTSPKMSEETTTRQSQAGPPARGTTSPGRPAGEVALMPAVDTRSTFGLDLEDGESFPPSASPEWWLGSVEARGTPARVSARSSPVGRAESSFLGDPMPGSQELQDGAVGAPLELWGSDMDTWGLDLRDDGVDSIFTDFLAC
ncbi:PREDICTED: spermatogenesis- and oogenesis-specific basic helix-loop-helix-containing protein 1 [Chinchilla lanigera]|uniref:BHLH domain-containing protein n=1 Tax=Chinchilla lanigera TaxID=34839 RepID=A0A8C2YLQ9_CHILA|nr:PREDICTED: spermatogenesis- and oogenesis-specific basic helix-loop-helix-containing protein 1 [Chinchilla lanigera]